VTGNARPAQAFSGDTDVWIVDLAASAAALLAIEKSRGLLTEAERARAERMMNAQLRQRWIAAHTALHIVLRDRIGRAVNFAEAAATVKPRVVDWSGDFSLSHTGDLVLIAVRDKGQVGIDAEIRRPVRIGDERRHLIEIAGAAMLPGAPLPMGDPEMSILAAWTRLEAMAKMRATGIGAFLEMLGIIANGPGADAVAERARQLIADEAQPAGLSAIDVGTFNAVTTLATSPPAGPPRLHTLSTEHSLLRA
jgi:4'-phosphopantetheinyl transferase